MISAQQCRFMHAAQVVSSPFKAQISASCVGKSASSLGGE
jgi:hypothetical protein